MFLNTFHREHILLKLKIKKLLRKIKSKKLNSWSLVSSFFYKGSKQARVPTFVCLFRDDATTAKGPGCHEGTNLRLRDFAVVPLMPTRDHAVCQIVWLQKGSINIKGTVYMF